MKFLPSVLTGILTVTSMFASNADRIGWNQLPISLCFAIVIGLFFGFIFWLNPLTNKSAAVVSSVFTACFFLWYTITPWVGLGLVVLAVVAGIRFKIKLARFTKPLTIILACALVVSVGQAVFISAMNAGFGASSGDTLWINERPVRDKLPNVYFIIPDRFPSIDALTESGIDSTYFVAMLRYYGFYVKENQLSHDAYTPKTKDVTASRTMRFIASVLNDGREVELTTPYKTINALIRSPSLIPALHRLGYEYHHVGSWFTETVSNDNADFNYVYKGGGFAEYFYSQEFNVAVWQRSILHGYSLKVLWSDARINAVAGARVVYQLGAVATVSEQVNQHFVFEHLILPHPPYVFTSDGMPQKDTALSEKELYYGQVKFAMNYLLAEVKTILDNDPTAIIMLQSDEGMAFVVEQELNLELSNTQWNGVLSAWRIPGADESELSTLKHTEILGWLVEWLK
jgi:hypothetical protein